MNYVLDASIALSWCFRDEATPGTDALLDRLQIHSAFVPEIWTLEVGNILIQAERHKRISFAAISQFLDLLKKLSIQIDDATAKKGFTEIIALAHSEKLTTYDAAYLELAMRLGLPLATKDKALAKAAKKMGIEIIK